ncbi:hypothetical protein V6N13_096823 [Hibiscus sabdariffa]
MDTTSAVSFEAASPPIIHCHGLTDNKSLPWSKSIWASNSFFDTQSVVEIPQFFGSSTTSVAAAASVASAGSEEFGETADGEVGAIESGSPSNPVKVNTVTSDVEIDQIKSGGKSESKDSRSMKHFKVALARFVKELLKPSWQQGNMSKEAFKTIVKKTVDKVSGAMKSHHIPKSRAKIDHYIESSQHKLTKLVTVKVMLISMLTCRMMPIPNTFILNRLVFLSFVP